MLALADAIQAGQAPALTKATTLAAVTLLEESHRADRHRFQRQITCLGLVHKLCGWITARVSGVQPLLVRENDQGVGAGMVALTLEHADLLAQAVALRLQVFGAGLQHLALGLKGRKGIHIQPGLRVLAGLQTRHNAVQVFTQQGDVKHGVWVLC